MRRHIAILLIMLLVGCGGNAPPTAQSVLDAFVADGLTVLSPKAPPRDPNSPLPNTFTEWRTLEIPGAATGRGGQVFTCDTKQNCDALMVYFTALKVLSGPYLYQSADGRVVVQLNSGLPPDVAAHYAAAVAALP